MAHNIFLRTLAFLLASSLCCVHARPIDEAPVPLDPNDAKAVEAAEFAIDQHNKDQNQHLTFVRVFQAAESTGDPEVVSYTVVITAEDGGSASNYDAYVQVSNDVKKLVAFWKRSGPQDD